MGQHLMAKKAGLSPAKGHPTQLRWPNQALWWPRSRALHFCAKGMPVEAGRGPKERISTGISERAAAAHVCLLAGRHLEAPAAPVTPTQCQHRAFWDENPSLQQQQDGGCYFSWGKDNSVPPKMLFFFFRGTDPESGEQRGKAPESPKPAQF